MDSDNLKILSSIIGFVGGVTGVIGGILGFFTFIDNYILRFKPRLNISGGLFFSFSDENPRHIPRGKALESIIFQIEVMNSRNKIGRINDFAIRIYNQSSTQPQEFLLYAKNILDRLPSKPTSLDKEKFNLFSPLSILGRSTKNTVIEFAPEPHRTINIPTDCYLKMELLYLLPNRKWKIAGAYNPSATMGRETNTLKGFVEYSLIDNAIERDEIKKILKRPKSSLYNGVSGKHIGIYLRKPIWITKRAIAFPFKVLKLITDSIIVYVRHIILTKLILPLINKKSKKLPRVNIGFPNAHLREDATNTLNKIKIKLQEIIDRINKHADKEAKITISSESSGFSMQRGRLTIKFYSPGDGHITAQDDNGYPHKFLFSMKLIEYPFGKRLWKVNDKNMTIDSACILFMDSFILLSY
ncbi:TPA: hypothetical protein QCJ61_003712 [Enterobacter asburiae]|nr:hypothetical protein [Enterobacter asburiae]HDR2805682.1 hypothetical protein [Enterobacter asburiae]HDR2811252.1 hypothetical protein [Enterobacter asburiae]HDR2816689.1 hypothetical protein [Enterobacter asburiae]